MSSNSNSLQAAVIQMVSGTNINKNLQDAAALLLQAREHGAVLAVLPENFAVFDSEQLLITGNQEATSNGPLRQWLSNQAKTLGLWVVAGTLPCSDRVIQKNRVRTSCFVYDNLGKEAARYDKIHLFDAKVNDLQSSYRESDQFEAGNEVVVVDSPIGKLGLSTCYDLRFAELYRMMADRGAEVICNGAAFTKSTGKAHWHPLLRARAIENQCYVLAAAQGGNHSLMRQSFGHSMIIDPWGEIKQELSTGQGVLCEVIDLAALASIRDKMPIAQHRKLAFD